MEDAWVIEFCTDSSVPFTRPVEARAALPGGGQTHWT
jgi:nicotinate-nucleotide pyrophosphorylase